MQDIQVSKPKVTGVLLGGCERCGNMNRATLIENLTSELDKFLIIWPNKRKLNN